MNLNLNEYQAVNLLETLKLLNTIGGNTGDWLEEIKNILEDQLKSSNVQPNQSVDQQLNYIENRQKTLNYFINIID